MNKKLLIIISTIVVILLFPLLGNSVVKQTIQNRLDLLNSYGVKTTLIKEEKGYITTKQHYTLAIQDEKKFMLYLQQFSSYQLPLYTKNVLEGVIVGVDVEYSNLPFSEELHIDIYPQKFPLAMMQQFQKDIPNIYKVLKKILQSKSILYHIDYQVVNGEFAWKMKDFNQTISLPDQTNITLAYFGVHGKGKGILVAPEMLETKIKQLFFKVEDNTSADIGINIKDLFTTTHFESKHTYITTIKVAKVDLKHIVTFDNLQLNGSLNAQHADMQSFVKLFIDHVGLYNNRQTNIDLEKVSYELAINGVDKENFIKLENLLDKENLTKQEEELLEYYIENIFQKGFVIRLPKFDIAHVIVDKKDLKSMHIEAKAEFLPSKSIGFNVIKSIMQQLQLNIEVNIKKSLYKFLSSTLQIPQEIDQLKKEQKDNVIFTIEMKKNNLYINGKQLSK